MPILSEYARKKKIDYFLTSIPQDNRILEVGCGSGWALEYLRTHGWQQCWGVDIRPPADYVGDIRRWRELGLPAASFDVIIAFEVVEHVNCFRECYDLLKPGGRLLLTSPLPRMDWFLKLLETLGLNQKRTSPHDCLVDFAAVPEFERKDIRIVGGLSQWGVFHKTPT